VGSASGPASPTLTWLGRIVGSLGPGLAYGNGGAELDFDREAATAADAIFSAISDIESRAGLRAVAVDADTLVSVLDIAERTGRTREAVRQAITGRRARPFPSPVTGASARHRLWRWSGVAAFYGLDDASLRQGALVADAANGWLALRRSVPELAPSADAVANAVRAA
jgi:hypothetical protein